MVISRQEVKDIVLDVVRNVVIAMDERVKAAEERAQNPFAYRTNIYRCEDGRPICYCCLRVGHVAKYCRDRMYSCPHNKAMEMLPVAPPVPNGNFDIQSLGRDMDTLLTELKQIANALKLSRTTPCRAEEIPSTLACSLTDKTDQVGCMEMRSKTMNYGVRCPRGTYLDDAERVPIYHTKNAAEGINTNCCDVT